MLNIIVHGITSLFETSGLVCLYMSKSAPLELPPTFLLNTQYFITKCINIRISRLVYCLHEYFYMNILLPYKIKINSLLQMLKYGAVK